MEALENYYMDINGKKWRNQEKGWSLVNVNTLVLVSWSDKCATTAEDVNSRVNWVGDTPECYVPTLQVFYEYITIPK